jgi:putative endonuclease
MMKSKDEEPSVSWSVYIVECADKTLYTGITTSPERRIAQHNNGSGAKYTRPRRPVNLVYLELLETHSAALKREYAIKQLSASAKRALVRSEGE